jgi:hypothetical protein
MHDDKSMGPASTWDITRFTEAKGKRCPPTLTSRGMPIIGYARSDICGYCGYDKVDGDVQLQITPRCSITSPMTDTVRTKC